MTGERPRDDYPKAVVLADGAHLRLRLATAADAGRLAALDARCERGARAVAPESLTVLALDGEQAAAAATLEPAGCGEARLWIALDPAYGGRRLGTWMLLDAVHLAAALAFERLVMHVRAVDAPLLAALERLDFVCVGRTAGDAAPVVLTKRLHRGWTDF